MPYTPTLEDLPDPTPAQREGAYARYRAQQIDYMKRFFTDEQMQWLEDNAEVKCKE